MPEATKPITNPQLVEAIKHLHQNNTPANQNLALDLVVNHAKLLAPVLVTPIPGKKGEKQQANIQFQLISTQDGRPFLPAFTDETELKKFIGEKKTQVMVVHFDQYSAMLSQEQKAQGLVINPMGLSLTLEQKTVLNLAQRKKELAQRQNENPAERGTQMVVGDPAELPEEMLQAVCEMAKTHEDIRTLWLRLMLRPDGAQRYMIVVEHTGQQDVVFQAITDAARPHFGEIPVDVIPADTGFAQAAIEDAKPFYAKA